MRILCYSDSPTAPTGFGTVARNIFLPLIQQCKLRVEDVAFFGINYLGDPHGTPFRVWPACVGNSMDRDPYGRMRFTQMALGNVWPFDVLFFLLDHFTLSQPTVINNQMQPFVPGVVNALRSQIPQGRPPFRVVQYIPVDADTVRPEWLAWMPGVVNAPVAYTEFGKRVCCETVPALTDTMQVIPHGTNPELFFPIPPAQRDAFRRQVFGVGPDEALIVNVNRNQPRKDIPRTLQVFKRVLDTIPNAKLYLHMNVRDSAGFDLEHLAHTLRIPQGRVVFPMNFSEGVGVPVEHLNMIYNAADVCLTTARGEGWGLGIPSEAMTAGACVIAPDHTSFSEILADGRGILTPVLPDRQAMIADNDQFRPVVDVVRCAQSVLWALSNRDQARVIARKGMEWARGQSWADAIAPMWWRVFEPPVVVAPARLRFRPPTEEGPHVDAAAPA